MATRPVITGAPTCAPSFPRRSLLAAFAAVPTLALPAAAVASARHATPFRIAEARYRAAEHRLNNLPHGFERAFPDAFCREENAYIAAVRAVDTAPVRDWDEFADAFKIACDDGGSLPGEDLTFKLLADVRRLSGRA